MSAPMIISISGLAIGLCVIYVSLKKGERTKNEKAIFSVIGEFSIITSAILLSYLLKDLVGQEIAFLIPLILFLVCGVGLKILSK